MCRHLPSTIHRYLDLPSTQRIQIHTAHRHITTPPLTTLVLAPYPLPTSPTPPQHRHMSNTPYSHRIGKAQTQSSSTHPPLHPRCPETNTHISHTSPAPLIPRTTLIHSMSAALDTIHEPHVPPTYLIHSPHQYCHHPHSLSIHTCNTNNSTCITVTSTTVTL